MATSRPSLARPGHEVVEVGDRAEVRVDRVVAAGRGADRPRRARVIGTGGQRVVPALARRRPDRVHRRQVDDVEPHRRDLIQPPRGGAERSRHRAAPAERVDPGPLRARKELIPGAVQRPLPVHDQRAPVRVGGQFPERELGDGLGHLGGERGTQPVDRCRPLAAQRCGDLVVQRPRRGRPGRRGRILGLPLGPVSRLGGPIEEQRALGQHQVDVLADRHLDRRVVPPVRDRVAPRLDPEMPQALARRDHFGPVAVGALGQLAHRHDRLAAARGIAQDDAGAEHLVPLAEHGGRHRHDLAGHGFGWPAAAVDERLNVENRNPADHHEKLPNRGGGHARGRLLPLGFSRLVLAGPRPVQAGPGTGPGQPDFDRGSWS